MQTPHERLRRAREAAGFESGTDAAVAMGVNKYTYLQHENGTRGFRAAAAEIYGRRFQVAAEWILFGKGKGPVEISEMTEASPIEAANIIKLFSRIPVDRHAFAVEMLAKLGER